MRLAIVLSLGLLLAGCVPTADFTELRSEVRQLQADNRKLKEEALKRQAEQDQPAKAAEVAKRLDALEAKLDALRARQQGLDQKVGELLRQADEASRRAAEQSAKEEEAKTAAREPKADAPGAPKPPASDPSILTPTTAYNQAYNDYLKGNYDLAIAGFEDFLKKFPATSLTAHAQYWIGESYFNKKEYRQAIDAYERVTANYPRSDKVPAALTKAGLAYVETGNAAKGRELLKQVLDKHPQTREAAWAKGGLAELK